MVVVTTELALWEEFERVGIHALGKTGYCQQGSSEYSHTGSEGRRSVSINSGKGTMPARFQRGTMTVSELDRNYSFENKLNVTELRRSG